MSHVALLITSERCGHCKNMRGNGRLLSQNEIKKDKKQATIPGGYHFDAKFMKKMICGGLDGPAKLRVVNVHLTTMNPNEPVKDISVFTLQSDNETVEQTMLSEEGDKVRITTYLVGENGKVKNNELATVAWKDISKKYIPVNMSGYCAYYPGIVLFESNTWTQGLQSNSPMYGYYNGFETKEQSPFGIDPHKKKQPVGFFEFLMPFFNGTRELLGAPKVVVEEVVKVEPIKAVEPEKILVQTSGSLKNEEVKSDKILIPTSGAKERLKFRLYVTESK